jgi:hypothetical protein
VKKIFLITIITSLIIGFSATPSSALSDNAEKFLQSCLTLDAPFPPPNWDKYDLRDAAIEVLDEIESGNFDDWPVDFCLKALGKTQFPEDVDRILPYENEMTSTVLRSLAGFPSTKAIECHLRWIGNEIGPRRELAIQGLADIDFKKLDDGKKWHAKVLDEIRKAKSREKIDGLMVVIDKSLANVEAYRFPKTE